MRALGGERFALAGYSMGGRIALHAALALGDRVDRLVLVGASPGIADPAERAARRAADDALADRIEAIGVEAFAREWAALPLWEGQPERVAAAAHADRLRNTPEGLAAALRGLGTGRDGAAVGRPAVAGRARSRSRSASATRSSCAIAERMAAVLPRAEVVVIPGAGHAAQLERLTRSPRCCEANVNCGWVGRRGSDRGCNGVRPPRRAKVKRGVPPKPRLRRA